MATEYSKGVDKGMQIALEHVKFMIADGMSLESIDRVATEQLKEYKLKEQNGSS